MKFSKIISISAFFALHAGGGAGRTPKQGRQKGEGRATRAGGRVGVAQRRGRARGTPRGDLKWSRNEYKEKYFFTILDEIPSLALHRKSLPNRPDRLKYRRPKVTQNPDDLFSTSPRQKRWYFSHTARILVFLGAQTSISNTPDRLRTETPRSGKYFWPNGTPSKSSFLF